DPGAHGGQGICLLLDGGADGRTGRAGQAILPLGGSRYGGVEQYGRSTASHASGNSRNKDRTMRRKGQEPPGVATAMLGFIADREKRETITGDLIEEFRIGERSKPWYWRQVMQSVGHSRSLSQTMGALMAGMTLVAAVSITIT